MAQWKRAGLITLRSLDRNKLVLIFFSSDNRANQSIMLFFSSDNRGNQSIMHSYTTANEANRHESPCWAPDLLFEVCILFLSQLLGVVVDDDTTIYGQGHQVQKQGKEKNVQSWMSQIRTKMTIITALVIFSALLQDSSIAGSSESPIQALMFAGAFRKNMCRA
jgi:hypothetical protein